MAKVGDGSIIEAISKISRLTTIDAVVAEFASFARRFGFTSVVMGHLRNPLAVDDARDPWMIASTWPADWYSMWIDRQFILHDPIAQCAARATCPFRWRDAYVRGTAVGKSILDESRNFGFREGLAVPARSIGGAPGCISLGAERIDLGPRELAGVELAAVHAYLRMEEIFGAAESGARKRTPLTDRETELLHYAAAGKTNWEIGEILSISEHTARDHFKAIARKLNCANRAHAVAVAIGQGLILP